MKTEQEIRDKIKALVEQYDQVQKAFEKEPKFQTPQFFASQIGVRQKIALLEWVLE